MRLATIVHGGRSAAAVVAGDRVLDLSRAGAGLESVRDIAAGGPRSLARVRAWAAAQPADAWTLLDAVELGPVVPDPGAIYTIGLNYASPGAAATAHEPPDAPPDRPLIYGKAASSVVGHGATVSWDRTVTSNVDPECELGVVIGVPAFGVTPERALNHVFGYTCINDISSRDPWLDGDQWLIGKSLPGFCPVGPWVVTADEIDAADLALGCTLNGVPVQAGRTADMRASIPAVIAYLSRHVLLRPGDLIATGTPPRLRGPLGPDRHLEPGDVVSTWIERIGELTVRIG